MDPANLSVFFLATLAFLLLPGPAVLYIVARSVDQGWRAGIVSCLGISFGTLGHVLAAAVGVSAILVKSATAFAVVKYLGAAYLVWLGISKLREKTPSESELHGPERSLRRLFFDGALVNLLNPKTALFFFAFLPQFVEPNASSPGLQVAYLGLAFIGFAMLTDVSWVIAAGSARRLLRRRPELVVAQKRVTAGVYLGLGILAAGSD